jgi:hypothetical protein
MSDRIEVANRVLNYFAEASIERRKNGWYVTWHGCKGTVTRRWQTRGQDFYPVWYRKWSGGGTATTALSQLIRWCADKPVLPLSTWRHWAGDRVKLLGSEAVDVLLSAGYPERATCVLCKNEINGGLDWWSLNGVTGPCCGWTTGCRQKPAEVA